MTTHHNSLESKWTFFIILYLCLIYLPFIISRADSAESYIQGDGYYYRAAVISVIEDGDLLLENNLPNPLNGQLAIGIHGFVPKHPILMPLISIPFYALFKTPGLLLFNILDCMILIALIFKINCLFHSRVIAFSTAIFYATGTLFLDYTYNYSPDIFSTVLFLSSLYFILLDKYYFGAVLLGFSIFAKIPNAPLVAVILIYAGFKILWGNKNINRRATVAVTTAALFFAALVPLAYTNQIFFGSPLITGYQRGAVAGVDGQIVIEDHTARFKQPLLTGIYQLSFDPRHGIIPTNPVLILSFLGIFGIKKNGMQDKAYLIIIVCLIQFILFAKYDDWATSHFSNRFLMTFIALSSVFTGNFLSVLKQKFWFDEQNHEEAYLDKKV